MTVQTVELENTAQIRVRYADTDKNGVRLQWGISYLF